MKFPSEIMPCASILDKKSWNTWCQRSLTNRLSPLPHYNVGRNSNGKQTTLHGVGGGGGDNLSLSVSTILSKIVAVGVLKITIILEILDMNYGFQKLMAFHKLISTTLY